MCRFYSIPKSFTSSDSESSPAQVSPRQPAELTLPEQRNFQDAGAMRKAREASLLAEQTLPRLPQRLTTSSLEYLWRDIYNQTCESGISMLI